MLKNRFFLIIIFFLFTAKLSYSNTIIVFVDNTRSLDYFVDGKRYKIKNDLKELRKEYSLNSENRLILVNIRKYSNKKIKGKICIVGKGISINKRFKSKSALRMLISDNVTSSVDLLLLSHTVSTSKLDEFLNFSDTNYGIILISACKMASAEKLKIMQKYSSLVLASPENIHLAHFDIKNLSKNLIGSNIDKGKRMLDLSFNRLLKFTKSNLVLNLYDLSAFLFKDNLCNFNFINKVIIDRRLKLSLFERRKESSKSFYFLNCLE